MRKYLWIGSFVTDELAASLRETGYKNPASVTSQKNILEGIESITGETFECIGLLAQKGYPRQKKARFREIRFSHGGKENGDLLVGHLNVQYINRSTGKRALVKAVKRWAKENAGERAEVFVYEMRSACLAAAKALKKLIPEARVHLIVPDLPQFMDLNMSGLKKRLKDLDWSSIQRDLDCVDDYILYTAKMADFLGIPDGKWTVMEGSINVKETVRFAADVSAAADGQSDAKPVAIMYSGSIQRGFGIEKLLKAFALLDNRYELWLTGAGDAAPLVKEYAGRDPKIKYYGFLPTRDDTVALQRKSTALINMRDPDESASDYCFPSKLFEYMLTGRPVLSCRLGGIPEEYFAYLREMDGIEPEQIAAAIRAVGEADERELTAKGAAGREFILKNKTNVVQAEKILDFINERK